MNHPHARRLPALTLSPAAILIAASACAHQPAAAPAQPPERAPLDWRSLEAPLLTRHVQLTSRDDFLRAGEQYFSPDGNWLIFQAIPVPPTGETPDPFYSMYVAKLQRDADAHVTGLEKPILVSPPGSANTCGWFNPVSPYIVIFGSTLVPPAQEQRSGFQVGTRKYKWLFPAETDIVVRHVPEIYYDMFRVGQPGGAPIPAWTHEAVTPRPIFSKPNYDAECSYSADGRFVLYARVVTEKDHPDADIFVFDTVTSEHHTLVRAPGYDGGPFFSPDGKRICFRSDRSLNDLLQLFVADLVFDDRGVPIATTNERQVTHNQQVNWAPFWHPSGTFLVYGNSGDDHRNYEVFAIEVDPAPGAQPRSRRVTFADGADILPVFSNDGKLMAWCSQRGPKAEGEARASSQIWIAECVPAFNDPKSLFAAP